MEKIKPIDEYEIFHEGSIADTKLVNDPAQYSFLNKFNSEVINYEGPVMDSAENIKNRDFGSFKASGYLKYSDSNMIDTGISRHKIYLNLCSISGNWDSGNISNIIGNRWKNSEVEFKRWYHSQHIFKLGELQEVLLQSDAALVNCLIFDQDDHVVVDACKNALMKVSNLAKLYNSIIYTKCSYDWTVVESQMIECIIKNGITVVVFEENM